MTRPRRGNESARRQKFWMPELGFYGIALDGEGRLCRVRASNAGHLLYTGLPSAERAKSVTEQLRSTAFDSGWGLRSLALGQARIQSHVVSQRLVWPHDTAICAAGMARYGDRTASKSALRARFPTPAHFRSRLGATQPR